MIFYIYAFREQEDGPYGVIRLGNTFTHTETIGDVADELHILDIEKAIYEVSKHTRFQSFIVVPKEKEKEKYANMVRSNH